MSVRTKELTFQLRAVGAKAADVIMIQHVGAAPSALIGSLPRLLLIIYWLNLYCFYNYALGWKGFFFFYLLWVNFYDWLPY